LLFFDPPVDLGVAGFLAARLDEGSINFHERPVFREHSDHPGLISRSATGGVPFPACRQPGGPGYQREEREHTQAGQEPPPGRGYTFDRIFVGLHAAVFLFF